MKRRLALEIALYDLIARKAWARHWNNYYNAAKVTTHTIAWRYSPTSPFYPTPVEVWRATDRLEKVSLPNLIRIARNSSFFGRAFVEAYDNHIEA